MLHVLYEALNSSWKTLFKNRFQAPTML